MASKMKTKQPLFPDEGSGAEVVLRPGDSVIVRGASQLRGHLVGLFGNHFVGHFCVLLVINSKITLKHLCMQLLWHLVSTLATLFLHYNPPFDTYTLAGCWESSEHAACPLPLSWAARTAIVAFKMFLESRTQDINSSHRVTWYYPIVTSWLLRPSPPRLRCSCQTVT